MRHCAWLLSSVLFSYCWVKTDPQTQWFSWLVLAWGLPEAEPRCQQAVFTRRPGGSLPSMGTAQVGLAGGTGPQLLTTWPAQLGCPCVLATWRLPPPGGVIQETEAEVTVAFMALPWKPHAIVPTLSDCARFPSVRFPFAVTENPR